MVDEMYVRAADRTSVPEVTMGTYFSEPEKGVIETSAGSRNGQFLAWWGRYGAGRYGHRGVLL